jgi:hypothetical protein
MPRGGDKREKLTRFNLVTGTDQYSSQTAQNPSTSRKLQSFIPSLAGDLVRESADPLYLNSLGSAIGFLFEYDRVNPDGSVTRFFFCATATQLFQKVSNVWSAITLPYPDGTTSNVRLSGYPQAVVANNLMQLSDGAVTWLFDGSVWVLAGLPIPQSAPSILPTSTTAQNITSIQRRSGIVTVNIASPLSIVTGTIPYPIALKIAGTVDPSLSGTFIATPITATSFSYQQIGLADTNDNTGTADWAHLTVTTNKYYWVAFLDQTTGRGLAQSDASPSSPGSGTLGGTTVEVVHPRFGKVNLNNGSNIVTFGTGGGGGGQTNETKAPTGFTNPEFGGDIAFTGPGNAFDGDPNTAATASCFSVLNGSSPQFDCVWGTWAAASGNYLSLSLTVISSAFASAPGLNGAGDSEVTLQYSVNNGASWTTILHGEGTDNASGGWSKTTSVISLPPGIPLSNIQVRAIGFTTPNLTNFGTRTVTAQMSIFEIFTTGTLSGTSGGSGSGGTFTPFDVGQTLYINGVNVGTIASIPNASTAILTNVWNGGTLTGDYLVAPTRATHWVLYASESENSQIGFQLAIIPVTTMFYVDSSPFVGNNANLYNVIERPVRNDPPIASKIQTLHKNRIFRRRETNPRFFNYTAYEEVLGNLNGSPQECTPGTDPNTVSDIVNEDPLNDDSVAVRALCSHGDPLYLGSEKNIVPLYGQSLDSFSLSNIIAFRVGVAGRHAMVSTPHGLAFVSYDKKVYLYPSQYPPGLAGGDATQYLIELSRPLRPTFEQMLSSDLDNIRLVFYNYGRRNWLVLAYQDNANVYHTWVYDFEVQSWFELQRGVTSLAVFEVNPGDRVLVGGDVTGQAYVLDDLTGNFTTASNLPVATFRPALIDWGKPDHYHVFRYVEFEVDNVNLGAQSISINYYFDPVNVDSLPAPDGTLTLTQVRGSNFFRGFVKGGALCYRMMLEIIAASDQNAGRIRGLNIVADEASSLIF